MGWPAAAGDQDVLAWLCNIVTKLQSLAADFTPDTVIQGRKLLAQPKTPLLGSTGRRSTYVGFVNDDVVSSIDRLRESQADTAGRVHQAFVGI